MKKLWAILGICALTLCACGQKADDVKETKAETAQTTETMAAETETAGAETSGDKGTLILATTTSTKDSGLLDVILPVFEEATGYQVDVVSVGSGEAMKMGENGEADVLLVHSPAAEKAFVEGGHADEDGRKDVMYNDFVLVGPKDDPAGIQAEAPADAVKAFQMLSETESTFISRSDESGTHKKELTTWKNAVLQPSGEWYGGSRYGHGRCS